MSTVVGERKFSGILVMVFSQYYYIFLGVCRAYQFRKMLVAIKCKLGFALEHNIFKNTGFTTAVSISSPLFWAYSRQSTKATGELRTRVSSESKK
jgi:hypothetical protein